MAYTEVEITELDIGAFDTIDSCAPYSWRKPAPEKLRITAKDGTKIVMDAPKLLIDLLEMVFLATEYGGEGGEYQQTLTDLLRVKADRDARDAGGAVA